MKCRREREREKKKKKTETKRIEKKAKWKKENLRERK